MRTRPPGAAAPQPGKIRLDQWLWFARLAKSRSLAARLCGAGAVAVNGAAVGKANQAVRIGEIVVLPQGGLRRTVRVAALGVRRGPAAEARLLYDEVGPALRLREVPADWVPLLDGDDTAEALR